MSDEKEVPTLEAAQIIAIELALSHHNNNRTHAAEALGCSLRTLRNYMRKFGLREKYPAAPLGSYRKRKAA